MGRSEWGVLLESKADYDRLQELILAHNEEKDWDKRGEDLAFVSILLFEKRPFAILQNGGGGPCTSDFIALKGVNFSTIYYPFEKPDGWFECQNYAWTRNWDIPLDHQEEDIWIALDKALKISQK